jgi:hypothetical protein
MSIPADPSVFELQMSSDADHQANVDALIQKFAEMENGVLSKQKEKKNEKRFVLVVIPEKGSVLYKQVKQAAELTSGILTQCVVYGNMKHGKRQQSTAENIILKVNAKIGGVSHVAVPSSENVGNLLRKIDILSYPVIILGIDVTHPPPAENVCIYVVLYCTFH